MASKALATARKMTKKRRDLILTELAEHGNNTHAAAAAGVRLETLRRHRRTDEEFEEQCLTALEQYADRVRREVHRRAVEGWIERGLFSREGERVGDVVKYSDRLLELLVKKHDHTFRDKVTIDATADVKAQVAVVDQLEKVLGRLDKPSRDKVREAIAALEAVAEAPSN